MPMRSISRPQLNAIPLISAPPLINIMMLSTATNAAEVLWRGTGAAESSPLGGDVGGVGGTGHDGARPCDHSQSHACVSFADFVVAGCAVTGSRTGTAWTAGCNASGCISAIGCITTIGCGG